MGRGVQCSPVVMTAVIVHGGAYAIPDTVAPAAEAGCKEAAEKAYKALLSGKSALDAGTVQVTE